MNLKSKLGKQHNDFYKAYESKANQITKAETARVQICDDLIKLRYAVGSKGCGLLTTLSSADFFLYADVRVSEIYDSITRKRFAN